MTGSTRITARSATEMLSLVPYMFGFHPWDSAVLLICTPKTVEVSLRFDYWMFDSPGMVHASVAAITARYERPRVFLATFGDDRDRGDEALAVLEQCFDAEDIIDSVHTDGQRWWSRACSAPCCPPEGNACDEATSVVAQAILAGSAAFASRAELERSVEGPSLSEQATMLGVYADAAGRVERLSDEDRVRRVAGILGDHLDHAEVGVDVACELAWLVQDVPPRDEAWLEMGMARAHEHVALWRQVVVRCPDRLAVAPLCLLAAAAWLNGNGALMACALARAESLDKDYSMLHLLQQVHREAVEPKLWAQVMTG
ncbi:DUF4192 domain-containing protein [Propionibacteriaceae bacterium G57]|uniref:DUF4192 domain-containing protein n=1 Tax=Aestuariimicrobium sp. G57 TaxID=3418485 RepID=UPI003DA780C9